MKSKCTDIPFFGNVVLKNVFKSDIKIFPQVPLVTLPISAEKERL